MTSCPESIVLATHAGSFGHASYYHSGVRSAAEDDLVEFFILDEIKNVLNMSGEINRGVGEMTAIRQSSQRGCVDLMSIFPELASHSLPGPTSAPSCVNQDKICHSPPVRNS